jgi:hypothetical protein
MLQSLKSWKSPLGSPVLHGLAMAQLASYAAGCQWISQTGPEQGSQDSPSAQGRLQSLMEPHALPMKGPWFEGWYARFTPASVDQPTIGVIVGSHLAPGLLGASHERSGLPGFVSVLISKGADEPLEVIDLRVPKTFLLDSKGRPVSRDPRPSAVAEFAWTAEGVGRVTSTSIELRDPTNEWRFVATLKPPRLTLAWDALLGPAGPATLLRALPLQWFVYGQSLEASWRFERRDGTVIVSESGGRAHFEKNWGKKFPERYVWLQGYDHRQDASIAAAGGAIAFSQDIKQELDPYLVLVNHGGRRWVFAPTNGAVLGRNTVDSCDGSVRLRMTSLDGELELLARAPRKSFGTILIPTGSGFEPGSEQSFTAQIRATIRTRSGETIALDIPSAALEFGGGHKCTSEQAQ